MDINNKIMEIVSEQVISRDQIYYGLDGYTIPLLKRISSGEKLVKQIVNGHRVADFHKKTNMLVRDIISTRAQKGIKIKNLILNNDVDLDIELTNPETLKESRALPASFDHNLMLAIIGDTLTITSLNVDNCVGIVINNKDIAQSFDSIFENLWNISKPV